MDKHILEFIDPRLTAETAHRCALHVVLGTDGISMMAVEADREILALQSWMPARPERSFESSEWDIRRIFRDEALLTLPYGHIHCAVFHRHTTLVPRRLFQHGALQGYFKLLLHPADYIYAYDELPALDTYLISAMQPNLSKLCAELFPQTRIRHQAVPLLNFARDLVDKNEHTVFVHFRNQIAQIVVFERQNLLFYNTFTFSAASDLLYYVLLAYEQFRLNPKEAPLLVAGNLLEDSDVYRILYRFIREIRFVHPSKGYRLPPDAQALPDHCHVELFCLTQS